MLQAILRHAATQQTVTMRQLAQQLDISPALLEQLVAELVRHGYLVSAAACATPCKGCAAHDACAIEHDPRLWTLTEKGARATRERHES